VALLAGVVLLEWVWLCWSGCGFVRVGVALLESMYVTVGAGFEVELCPVWPTVSFYCLWIKM